MCSGREEAVEIAVEVKAVIDRIVDDTWAVLLIGEEEKEENVPVDRLPPGAKPGDWLRIEMREGEIVRITADPEETEAARARIAEKLRLLRQRGRPR